MEKQVKVISLISDDFEDLELWYPILRCREAGVQVDVAGAAGIRVTKLFPGLARRAFSPKPAHRASMTACASFCPSSAPA